MGARSVRQAIADAYDPQQIEITIVWAPMLGQDTLLSAEESSRIFSGYPSIRQFWDPQRRAGLALRKHIFPDAVAQMDRSIDEDHFFKAYVSERNPERPEWDIYMFFAKGDHWNDAPPAPRMWLRQTARFNAGDDTLVSLMWKNDYASKPLEGQVVDQLHEMASMLDTESSDPNTLEFLAFPGCPNSADLRATLVQAIGTLRLNHSIIDVNLQELDQDDPRLRYGSPTILINGVDLMGTQPLKTGALCCRTYDAGELPNLEEIIAKLSDCCSNSPEKE